MLKYFLEEQEPHIEENTVKVIKTRFIKKKEYQPFHLDCQFTRKKICHCEGHPIARLPKKNRLALWQSFEDVNDFYKKINNEKVDLAQKLFTRSVEKIRNLSRTQIADFVRNFRNEKSLHMGQNGEYESV